jgi:transposase
MAISEAAETPGIQDTRLWRMLPRYVDKAHAGTDWSMLKRVMDETSRRKGHRYVTCFVDLDGGNLPDMTEGRDAATVKAFTSELTDHQ